MTDENTATKKGSDGEAAAAAAAAAEAEKKTTTADGMIPQAQLDAEVAKRTAVEKEYDELASDMLAAVPDHLKALIPEGNSKAKIEWFKKAKTTGIFDAKATVPPTDGGEKPATSPKNSDQQVDLSKMPAVARMAHGYAKH
jgi:hypothetical protein